MISAYVTTGELLNKNTVKLDEKITLNSNKVKIIIEPIIEEKKKKRQFGCLKGKIIMKSDFNNPLEEFREYMP